MISSSSSNNMNIKRIQIVRAPPSPPPSSYSSSSNDEEDEEEQEYDGDNDIYFGNEEEEETAPPAPIMTTATAAATTAATTAAIVALAARSRSSPHLAFGLACILAGNYFEKELARVKQLPAGIYPLTKTDFNGYMMSEVMYGPLMPMAADAPVARKMHQDNYFEMFHIDNPYLKLVKCAEERYQFKVVLVGDANIEIHTY